MVPNGETLLAEERRDRILSHLADQGSARVADLATQLRVSAVTIRRDLELLDKRGEVKRVHGGVTLRDKDSSLNAEPGPTGLRTYREGRIGMVVPSLDYYWPSVVRGAKDAANQHDAHLLLRESTYSAPEQDRAAIDYLVTEGNVHGLLLTVDVNNAETLVLIEELAERGIPTVLVERDARSLATAIPFEGVTSDHHSGAMLGVELLTSEGHRNIGLVGPDDSPTMKHLIAGWEQATEGKGLTEENTLTRLINNSTPERLREDLEEVLDQCLENGITGLIVHADPEANIMVQSVQHRGLEVPGDITIVSYDDDIASLLTPALTAVRPPRYTIGRVAVDMLLHRLHDTDAPVQRTKITPRLAVRESTAPPRERN